ncbi:DUF2442 domain-containing protein [Pigmentiphaga litoralis]|uniref:DUF2442 domain-containing protein n=1 Tax=Pigmentiphaga litoralis TaxID=516702 RepID=A0A7Y9LNI4_9BURK|nr:DUF2442 domain-containing protein [Pigmentiphaga litoralis]NYE23183.1 hypothetical protein [Pigmentiphaga litoralis]NYE83203.1 hypothetical protein [Pigmentiphaga litoralis]
MDKLNNAEIDAAIERGKIARASEPRAASARFDTDAGRVTVELENGCVFAFPPGLVQELATATLDQLGQVQVIGNGFGLYWEALDADVAIPSLMAGLFGTQAWMARRAGQTTSPAKAAAARHNGALGGRPRKSAVV